MEYIASSKPHYITVQGRQLKRPTITFQRAHTAWSIADMEFEVWLDGEAVQQIRGKKNGATTAKSFRLQEDVSGTLISLAECLRLNDIFTNVRTVLSEDGSEVEKVTADMDLENHYILYNQGRNQAISFIQTHNTNKTRATTLTYNTDETTFQQSKVSLGGDVKFDIASPWSNTTFKYPKAVTIDCRTEENGKYALQAIGETEYTILPTTLSLYEKCEYTEYYAYELGGERKEWLTRNFTRAYNYGEEIVISHLSSIPFKVKANYYTNSGVYLYTKEPSNYVDATGKARMDYYINLDVEDIETLTSRRVGYVEVSLWDYNGNEITNTPMRYEVRPRCEANIEVFFVNAIGGIDSFNAWSKFGEQTSISDLKTYNVNQMLDDRDFEGNTTAQYETVHTKKNQNKYTLTTNKMKRSDVEWLRELQKSKWTFIRLSDWDKENTTYQMVIVDDMTVSTDSNTDDYSVSVTFHTYGSNLKF